MTIRQRSCWSFNMYLPVSKFPLLLGVMAKLTLPQLLRTSISFFMKDCPSCGRSGTKPGLAALLDSPLTLRRWTLRTVSLECRRCGFRFSFRWESFRNALAKRAELESASGTDERKKGVLSLYGKPIGLIEELLDYRKAKGSKKTIFS